jgi:hypothetical protein
MDLGVRSVLYLVVDADSPQQWTGWNEKTIPLTPAEEAALPAGIGTIEMTLDGSKNIIPGIKRVTNGRLEWLIRPLPDPVVTMFNSLPGPGGWTDPAAKATWANIGQILLSKGVSPAELIAGFPALFNAARDEIL